MLRTRRAVIVGITGAAAGVAAFGYVFGAFAADVEGVSALSPAEALQAVRDGSVVLIDIRRPDEWARTGVPEGAVPIDMRRPDFAEAVRAAQAEAALPVALICARGVRSRRMTQVLTEVGFDQIIDVPEGMLGSFAGPGWLKKGLPVVAWSGG